MQDDTLELLISIGHYARVHRRFDEAHYLFDRLALLYPQRAFPYLGQGLVELDRANYRGASLLFGRALDARAGQRAGTRLARRVPDFEGHYALGARTLMAVADGDEPGASSMAAAFLNLPECAPYTRAARAVPAVASISTIERLTNQGGH